MLSDAIKSTIRSIHKSIGQSLNGYQPRRSQNFIVAEIAKTLAGEFAKDKRIAVIEAGTGTGKSLAYCLGTIPYALKTKKKVVISTATVALQEQLVNKDLPFFHRTSGLDFQFLLVKGRQRYVCLSKLQAMTESNQDQLGFEQLLTKPLPKSALKTYEKMLHAYQVGEWNGELDTWPKAIEPDIWSYIQSDRHSCNRALEFHRHCPFHAARQEVNKADVLIVNHHLLLADIELGGGKLLPPPEDTIYIVDEAHHLPDIARSNSAVQVSVGGAVEWLSKVPNLINKLNKTVTSQLMIQPVVKAQDYCAESEQLLKQLKTWLGHNHASFFPNTKDETHRFEHGVIPDTIKHIMEDLTKSSHGLLTSLQRLIELLTEGVSDRTVKIADAEALFVEGGFFIQRVDNLHKLASQVAKERSEKAPPLACWLSLYKVGKAKKVEYAMAASPLEIGFLLADGLWTKCEGAILCSATLTALNKFDYFRHQVGLDTNDGTQYLKVDSPFNYRENATLHIPKAHIEPTSQDFSDYLVDELKQRINPKDATLVLFSSYWQMDNVADGLRANTDFELLIQGESSRQALLENHKKAIDANKGSILFGTQGLSEGLDLPGKYLTHLIITKIPFAVPTSPVEEAHAEFISAKGGNPFLSLTVPEASRKLIQACGRLIRTEKDIGTVTLLDRRIVSKRYGKSMLDALPPFKRHIDY